MTVGSLFAGIGGFDLGLERAGFLIRWQVESNAYCQRVLARHWPRVPRYGDIRSIDWSVIEPVDLVCGGFPCQAVSLAGKRRGAADARWLWPEFAECVRVLRPRIILVENVPGLLSADDGRLFADILRDLAAGGYNAEWDCVSTGFGRGHYRPRVFLVAYADGAGQQGRIFSTSAWSAFRATTYSDRWIPAPSILRRTDGLPYRVERIRGLGNAVVPQIVEWIGVQIMNGWR